MITVNTKAFQKELEWASKFVERKSTIPILKNVALIANDGILGIAATDLEISGYTSIAYAGADRWNFTVPAKSLTDYIKSVKAGQIDLACDLDELRLTVIQGSGSTEIGGDDAEKYPVLPSPPGITHELTGIDEALPRVLFAASKEENRFTLNGALLEITAEGSRLVATDGHRLSMTPVACPGGPLLSTIVRSQALALVQQLDGRVWFGMDPMPVKEEGKDLPLDPGNQVFTNGHRTIISRKLKGNFPDYGRVIPQPEAVPFRFTFRRDDAKMALNSVGVFADERSRGIKIILEEGACRVRTQNDSNTSSGTFAAEGAQPGYEAGFNGSYLQQYLTKAPEMVTLHHNAPANSIMLTSEDGWKYVVMPFRMQ